MSTHSRSTTMLAAMLLALAACSSKAPDMPQPVPVEKAGTVNPVELSLKDSQPYHDAFSIPINQAQGKQDYFITQPTDT